MKIMKTKTIMMVTATIIAIVIIMVALWNRTDQYIFILSLFFFLFFPHLISAITDWMSAILLHMVWP